MIKLWALPVLLIFYAACQQPGNESMPLPPNLLVDHNDRNLEWHKDLWRYNGKIFSGYITQQQANNLVIYKLPVINGLANGLSVGFYDNGQKMLEQHFANNKPDGPFRLWWRNGQYKYIFFYKEDKYDGVQKVFFEDGKLREESNYKNGSLEGLQRVWDRDGKLVSNYTIRNNKLYGIVKVKSCIPDAKN